MNQKQEHPVGPYRHLHGVLLSVEPKANRERTESTESMGAMTDNRRRGAQAAGASWRYRMDDDQVMTGGDAAATSHETRQAAAERKRRQREREREQREAERAAPMVALLAEVEALRSRCEGLGGEVVALRAFCGALEARVGRHEAAAHEPTGPRLGTMDRPLIDPRPGRAGPHFVG
jgi:hypothetical protein